MEGLRGVREKCGTSRYFILRKGNIEKAACPARGQTLSRADCDRECLAEERDVDQRIIRVYSGADAEKRIRIVHDSARVCIFPPYPPADKGLKYLSTHLLSARNAI